jgi:hypothetical protein
VVGNNLHLSLERIPMYQHYALLGLPKSSASKRSTVRSPNGSPVTPETRSDVRVFGDNTRRLKILDLFYQLVSYFTKDFAQQIDAVEGLGLCRLNPSSFSA